jgi:hypothetical protein
MSNESSTCKEVNPVSAQHVPSRTCHGRPPELTAQAISGMEGMRCPTESTIIAANLLPQGL